MPVVAFREKTRSRVRTPWRQSAHEGFCLNEVARASALRHIVVPVPAVPEWLPPSICHSQRRDMAGWVPPKQHAAFDPGAFEVILTRHREALRRTAVASGLPEGALDGLVDGLLPPYARADQLALRYQQLYLRAAVGLFVLAALALTCGIVQLLFFPDVLALILPEVVAMVAALGLVSLGKGEAWQAKWLPRPPPGRAAAHGLIHRAGRRGARPRPAGGGPAVLPGPRQLGRQRRAALPAFGPARERPPSRWGRCGASW
jgi:hypothetical protein